MAFGGLPGSKIFDPAAAILPIPHKIEGMHKIHNIQGEIVAN